jgi:hypothetical protein
MELVKQLGRGAMLAALLAGGAVACSSAPDEGANGASENDLIYCGPYGGIRCCRPPTCCPPGIRCIPAPPPPHLVSSWTYSSVANAANNPISCIQNSYAPAASVHEQLPDWPPWSNTIDPVSQLHIKLMSAAYGCSTPIRYSTFRPYSTDPGSPASPTGSPAGLACNVGADPMGYDYAFMYMQLCPYGDAATQSALNAAVSPLGMDMMAHECILPSKPYTADISAHVSTNACSQHLPLAPAGYAWAITSIDPSCPAGQGCMINSGGGPMGW